MRTRFKAASSPVSSRQNRPGCEPSERYRKEYEAGSPETLPSVTVTSMRALGTRFADVAALQVAGKHNPRVTRQNVPLMHMAKRPVVVAVVTKLLD